MNTAASELLERLDSFESLRGLLDHVGFGDAWTELVRDHWPQALNDLDSLRRLALGADRNGLTAVIAELDDFTATSITRFAHRLRAPNPAKLFFFVCTDAKHTQLGLASYGTSSDLRILLIERAQVRATDVEALQELVPQRHETGLALALKHARVLDRSRVTRKFFVDFKAQRSAIAGSWKRIPKSADDDRQQLALLFLCRLVFLYFLQRRGHLGDDPEFLFGMWRDWTRRKHSRSFFDARLKPLFFGVLNTRPDRRSGGARRFGALPYLNGGLFERSGLERKHRKLDLGDGALRRVFEDLLQRYRFTTHDSAHAQVDQSVDAGVDPEMLGRVFEELMADSRRGDTGTYFTPPRVVDRLVTYALDAWLESHDPAARPELLRNITVIDPACGSGAFLLGALGRIAQARNGDDQLPHSPNAVKREIVERVLHGVDLQSEAALLCALRLWLCLLPTGGSLAVQPLPNLDRRIRQGDALIDPLDLALSTGAGDLNASIAARPEMRAALTRLRPVAAQYVSAGPEDRDRIRVELQQTETQLAASWLNAGIHVLEYRERDLAARTHDIDLFGQRTDSAVDAHAELERVTRRRARLALLAADLREKRELPFFSFPVHFAETAPAGFDLVLSNPPWVRAHRWPASLGSAVRERYEVCRKSGWRAARHDRQLPAAQVDLSLLFLERGIRLLKPNGALAMLLPAKTFRSLYAGGARALLLRETRIARIEDHSLDQHSIFRADAFAGAIIACRAARSPTPILVSAYRKGSEPLEFEVPGDDLPLIAGDEAAPWLLVPAPVRRAIRSMQACAPALRLHEMRARRGIFTGANEVLLIDNVVPKLGDHAWIRAAGYENTPADRRRAEYRALIEESVLRPVIRGADLRAWSYHTACSLIWGHDARGRGTGLPPRAARYLKRHEQQLRARTGTRPSTSLGAVFRVAPHTYSPKLAWRDLAPDLEAVALPHRIRSYGRTRDLIPLNTVYYVPLPSADDAQLLAGYFNALPCRTFARAIAERAKDAHFRFFAWVIELLPLPRNWRTNSEASRIRAIAATAHQQRGLSTELQHELDQLVATAYGLSKTDFTALADYDAWLRGEP